MTSSAGNKIAWAVSAFLVMDPISILWCIGGFLGHLDFCWVNSPNCWAIKFETFHFMGTLLWAVVHLWQVGPSSVERFAPTIQHCIETWGKYMQFLFW